MLAFRRGDLPDSLLPALMRKGTVIAKARIAREGPSGWALDSDEIPGILIKETGRLVDFHQNDLLISWNALRERLDAVYEGRDTYDMPVDLIETFALRKMGVDHTTFFLARLGQELPEHGPQSFRRTSYREVLVLRIALPADLDDPAEVVLVDASEACFELA